VHNHRLSARSPDAKALAREFQPKFEEIDLVNLPNHQIYPVFSSKGHKKSSGGNSGSGIRTLYLFFTFVVSTIMPFAVLGQSCNGAAAESEVVNTSTKLDVMDRVWVYRIAVITFSEHVNGQLSDVRKSELYWSKSTGFWRGGWAFRWQGIPIHSHAIQEAPIKRIVNQLADGLHATR
jgi:hypothetical protein